MVRLEGWERRLSDHILEHRKKPHVWGENDCILFAAKGFEKITGINTYDEYLGYGDKEGAMDILTRNGGFEKLISKHIGPSHRNKLMAKRGDICLIKTPDLCLGIVDDSGQGISCMSETGFMKIPLKYAWRIWSYG